MFWERKVGQISRLKTIKSYYENRYVPGDMGPSRRAPHTYRVFVDWLDVKPAHRFLDVACGTGPLLQCAGADVGGNGIDLSQRAARAAQTNAPYAHITVGDMQRLPYANCSFDRVANLGGLEHVPNMEQALREMVRVCASGGSLCIMVPNASFFWYRVLPVKGTQQVSMEEHLLTLSEWEELLCGAGLRIVRVAADPGPNIRTNSGLRMFMRSVLRRLALMVTMLMPVTSTYQFVFICRKLV